jgi:hypothetical protein
MNASITQIVGIVTAILVIVFILNDTPKRTMGKGWAVLGFLGLVGLAIYLMARKPIQNRVEQNDGHINLQTQMRNQNIPDNCPHCKNPNTKKIRLCEWCGNQIC